MKLLLKLIIYISLLLLVYILPIAQMGGSNRPNFQELYNLYTICHPSISSLSLSLPELIYISSFVCFNFFLLSSLFFSPIDQKFREKRVRVHFFWYAWNIQLGFVVSRFSFDLYTKARLHCSIYMIFKWNKQYDLRVHY